MWSSTVQEKNNDFSDLFVFQSALGQSARVEITSTQLLISEKNKLPAKMVGCMMLKDVSLPVLDDRSCMYIVPVTTLIQH